MNTIQKNAMNRIVYALLAVLFLVAIVSTCVGNPKEETFDRYEFEKNIVEDHSKIK